MLKERINGLALSEIFYFISIAVYDGQFEITFWVDFDLIISDLFDELGEFSGNELLEMWDMEDSFAFLEADGYSVELIDSELSRVLIHIEF